MLIKNLPLLATDNIDMVATIVVIAAVIIIMSFVVLGLALAANFMSKKTKSEQRTGQAQKARTQQAKKPANGQAQKVSTQQVGKPANGQAQKTHTQQTEKPANVQAEREDKQPLLTNVAIKELAFTAVEAVQLQLDYHEQFLLQYHSQLCLPSAEENLLLGGGAQLELTEHTETVEELSAEEEGLTLKESIALAMATASTHLNINKKTVAAWLTENYGDEIKLNRRADRTKTGLPLADTHYLNKKGKSKCFIYVYDLSEEKSMLLLRADYATANEIIDQYPSIKKSRFPKSTSEQWCTLIPDLGFKTEKEVYDIIALIIARLAFADGENQPEKNLPVTNALEEDLPPVNEPEEVAPAIDEGVTLKESMAIAAAAASKNININKITVAAWLNKKYGKAIQINRRVNRTKTGLPLADTHYINKADNKKCFIYVYELGEGKSLLLLRADNATANEIISRYPSIRKSRFPKASGEQWYTLFPDIGFETEEEIYDIIALIIERLAFRHTNKTDKTNPPVSNEVVPVPAPEKEKASSLETTDEEEEEDKEEEDEELPPDKVDVEVAARGFTLKESIALANAMAQTKINKHTVAVWLNKKYGDAVVLNRRENKIKTGLPLADTHFIMSNGKKKCFIYVYELENNNTFLLLKTDGITASEIAAKDPLFLKSRFPKSKFEQWYTLIPDVCYKNAKEVFDVIELVISRFLEKNGTKVLYDKVYEKRHGHRKPGKKFAVNCDTLAKNYLAGETVDIKSLKDKGIVPQSATQIKILARGALSKPLTVIADDFSADAIYYISKIGGKPILTD